MNTLSMQSIRVTFGNHQALDGVSLDCHPGEITMLVGPNGAGKSTLIKVLLGLVRPDGGLVTLNNQPCKPDRRFKEQLGYLPEAVAFAENLTGRQVLRFFAAARGCKKAEVELVLDRIGLTHAAKRAVRGYSRGMRQRLGLGTALLGSPNLLVLDEPTGGLDQEGLTVLWDVLTEWREEGRMVLMCSHDLTLLEHRVDRLCLLQEGRVRAVGSPTELRDRAGLPITVAFQLSGECTHVTCFLDAVRDCNCITAFRHENSRLVVELPPDELLNLMNLKALNDRAVRHIRVNEPGLDDVYEQLLREVG